MSACKQLLMVMIPDELLQAVADARAVTVLTGAGVSAESGVPTFREAQTGLWARYDPLKLATPEAFAADPALVWDWYRFRRNKLLDVLPNAGHHALAELQNLVPDFTLVTQNVDGLHERAGSTGVVEFHGNLFVNRCSRDKSIVAVDASGDLPACPDCGAPVRPGVIWFGEAIPESCLERAFSAARNCDVFLSIGTSSLVYPAAGLVEMARDAGATLVEINTQPTSIAGSFHFVLAGRSGELLPALVNRLRDHRSPGTRPGGR
jgi:NAD-dependent deacetylase